MMKFFLAVATFAAGAAAFTPQTTTRVSTRLAAEAIADGNVDIAIPEVLTKIRSAEEEARKARMGVEAPPAEPVDLDEAFGVTVETGFKCTPLGKALLEDADESALEWFQNAELKHGRIAMIATIGYLNQKIGVHFPLYFGPTGSNSLSPGSDDAWFLSTTEGVTFTDIANAATPMDAVMMIPSAGFLQILFAAGIFEATAYNRQYNMDKRVPGDYGYDPLGFTKVEGGLESEKIKKLRIKEIKNGRLAMLAIAGWTANDAIPGALPVWHP